MIRTIKTSFLFLAAMLCTMLSNGQTGAVASKPAPQTTENANWEKTDGLYAVFNTNKGKIVCQLEYVKIPMTVGNFVSLVEGTNPATHVRKGEPFYDGLKFHRVIPNFMIQGGDPLGSGMGDPGYKFPDEFDPSLRHTGPGTLSMANAGPGTNGSQFFITHVATPWLNDKHTIFGHVVLGQAVVNAIAGNDTMRTVRIVRIGKTAKAFDGAKAFVSGEEVSKKKQEEAMQVAIKKHNEDMAKKAASYPEWDAKVKAKYPTAKKTASGLYYVVDQEGSGAVAKPGQTVVAHYTGTLLSDGSKFDSSVDRGQPFEFPLGQHRVIEGWDEGFGLFKVGAKGKLIIPYYLAYGDNSPAASIPAKSDLVFEVEMLGVK
ncbi:MAG: Peptidylprolyl isomerase [Bacteroidetes bacterium]|nr:Peptidylprolyl isomerase [Bacteroidota bacterium]